MTCPTIKDHSLIFESTVELYKLEPLPASGSMPSGWRLRMPLGKHFVIADMYTLQPRRHGAYRLVASGHVDLDEWEDAAINLLGDLLAVFVTSSTPMTDDIAEGIARRFHLACAVGTGMPELAALRAPLSKVVDPSAMQWVTVRQGSHGKR